MGRPKIIIIIGAPGVGKTTTAKLLSKHLKAILIRRDHFRTNYGTEWKKSHKREANITYAALLFMAKKYLDNGYRPLVLEDIMSYQASQLKKDFRGLPYLIVNLVMNDDRVQKKRVLAETRESVYRSWKDALMINRFYHRRKTSKQEIKIDTTHARPATVVKAILKQLK